MPDPGPLPVDDWTIRHTCAAADTLATKALTEEAAPPPTELRTVWDLMAGHLRLLADEVDDQYALIASRSLRALVDRTVSRARDLLSGPPPRSAYDLLTAPPVCRLLLALHQHPGHFTAGRPSHFPTPGDERSAP